ncbi:MAG: DUF6159 family protein [Anaerolineales bacterium]
MFASIRRGFGFLGQSIDMARKDSDLLKPSFFGLLVSIVVAGIGAIPIVLVSLAAGDTKVGQYSLYALSALLIFAQYAVAYIFSGMTAYLVYEFLTEGNGQMESAWRIVTRDWLDLLSLAAASTVVKLIENTLRGRGGRGNVAGGVAASIINAVWTTATYFVLPAMVIEDLSLPQALKRATYLIKNNLLLVAVTEIGVGTVVGLAGFILVIAAVIVGVLIFVALAQLSTIVAIVAAVLVAGVAIALVTALTSYVTTAYHTSLFLWAREAERAVSLGQSAQSALAPAPLRAILATR